MKKNQISNEHPGSYIKQSVIPAEVTVTGAAKMLGIGRPALSNMLNGNAALSIEMATRIEKTFGASSDKLLKMQADYERSLAYSKEAKLAVRTYVPSFMDIKAKQIEEWSESMMARAELAVLLRRLVISTGDRLTKVDFPAFENSQRKGWDGQVNADAANPWIPLGESGWEFGTSRDPRRKAEDDFNARTKSIEPEIRENISFIFVTPRNWEGKDGWSKKKNALGKWQDVRAYDANDLEQWLEISIPAQAWMAERFSVKPSEVQSLEANWKSWADVTDPPLSKLLFQSAIQTHSAKLAQWLESPIKDPLTVSANSVDEALAALSCIFESELVRKLNKEECVLVIKSSKGLSKVANFSTNLIIVLASADAERESAGIHRLHHTIIVTRRNAVKGDPDIFLDLVERETLETGLKDMGQDRDRIDRLVRESGCSLTVLRRRLSSIPAINTPPWASQKDVANFLIPLTFVGAWDIDYEADQEVLAGISGKTYVEIEKAVVELLAFEQSPVWSIDNSQGVISKVDAFFGIRDYITKSQLDRFFTMAHVVLSEIDPSMELPADKQWAAVLYNKSRQHSNALRQGICETLVVLSVHGKNLFSNRFGFDVNHKIDVLICKLLTPLDSLTWQSQRNDLAQYAEAAPPVFLNILEQDLRSNDPKVYALMQPADSGIFSSPGRTGLLQALEVLAWNPQWLPRVVVLLGKLAELTIIDNWGNRPDESLKSIFSFWMPQTAATFSKRIDALKMLIEHRPDVGWCICINQFDMSSTLGNYSARPRWRNDAIGFGEQVINTERCEMKSAAIEMALNWQKHDAQTLGDIIERLDGMGYQDQLKFWSIVDKWISEGQDDQSKAMLRERIRFSTMTRRSQKRLKDNNLRDRAKAVYDALIPDDLISRHHWLFVKHWVEESADDLAEKEIDFIKRDEHIAELRESALCEIWKDLGYSGITRLCQRSEAPEVIGSHLSTNVFDVKTAQIFVDKALASNNENERQRMDRCLSGLLHNLEPEVTFGIINCVIEKHLNEEAQNTKAARILICAPFTNETWEFVDRLSSTEKHQYWKNIYPVRFLSTASTEDKIRAVDELLNVKRPLAALRLIECQYDKIKSSRLVQLLYEAATNSPEPKGYYHLDPYYISEAFKELTIRTDVLPDELARLEFLYMEVLRHTEHGIKNLENQLSRSPELYFQMVAFVTKRTDDGQDPPELQSSNAVNSESLARSAYILLEEMKQTPGTGEDGNIDTRKLHDWVACVLKLAREHAREPVAEIFIGQLLGRGPKGEDGIWPHEAVREVLEDIGTSGLSNGIQIGHSNSRGAVWRGEGEEQERALAATFREWSRQISSLYLFTVQLLEDMAQMYDRDAEWYVKHSKINRYIQD